MAAEAASQLTLVDRLLRKRDLLQQQDSAHEDIRTALLIDGGGMRGAYGAGAVIALRSLGLTDTFDYVIGVSAGAADCAYFLSGEPELGTSLYYEELSGRRFINLMRPRKILDVDYLDQLLREAKPLDVHQIRQSRSEFLVGLTRADTGACTLLNVKDPSLDVVDVIRATCAIPILYNRSIAINGTDYVDGGVGCGLPVDYVLQELQCTDVLVVLNSPPRRKERPPRRMEKVAIELLCRHFPKALREELLHRNQRYADAFATIAREAAKPGPPYVEIISPTSVAAGRLTTDSAKMRTTATLGGNDTLRFFGVSREISIERPTPRRADGAA